MTSPLTAMSDQGLLPCPFCGGSETAFENLYDDEDDEIQKCWTVVHECPSLKWGGVCLPPIVVMRETEADAIAAWNTRTPPTTGDNPVPISNIKDKTDGN